MVHLSVALLEELLDDGEDNEELTLFALEVGESAILLEGLLGLSSLVDEKGGVTTIVDNHVASLAIGPEERG